MSNKIEEHAFFMQILDKGGRVTRGTFTDSAQKLRFHRWKKSKKAMPPPVSSNKNLSYSDSDYEKSFPGYKHMSCLKQQIIQEAILIALSKKDISSSTLKSIETNLKVLFPRLFVIPPKVKKNKHHPDDYDQVCEWYHKNGQMRGSLTIKVYGEE